MARGQKVDIDEYLTILEPFLKVGCSLHESCVNGFVPYTTMVDYMKGTTIECETVRRKIDSWGNEDIRIARESVVNNMKEDGNLALKYLERKKKDEFSTRIESENKEVADFSKPDESTLEMLKGE